jgi:hypothetical protein
MGFVNRISFSVCREGKRNEGTVLCNVNRFPGRELLSGNLLSGRKNIEMNTEVK